MVHPSIIEARLGELGFNTSRWFKSEIHELQHILMDDEKIVALACGRYFGSFALLVATDLRLLLIDKRVFFMTIEDTRYDMISEIDLNMQVYAANLTVYTMNKTHKFTTVKYKKELRQLATYAQRRVWEVRQSQEPNNTPIPGPQITNIATPAAPVAPTTPTYYPTAPTQPPPLASQPTDYYVDDNYPDDPHIGGHEWRGQLGHVAHRLGTAATRAAHTPSLPHRPVNPYLRGSLMSRRPLGQDYYQY